MKRLIKEGKMKKAAMLCLALFVLFLGCSSGSDKQSGSPGQSLFYQAQAMDRAGAYISADALYKQARTTLLAENNPGLADQCRLAIHRDELIIGDYNTKESEVRAKLQELWPDLTESKLDWMIERIDHINIEGADYYWSGYVNTAANLDLALMAQLPNGLHGSKKFWDGLAPYVFGPPQTSGSPYRNPINFAGVMNADVPRDKLPATGTLKIWMPLPILTDCQTNASLDSFSPTEYLKHSTELNGDLGDLYLEVPLEQLTGNLQASYHFQFTHFEQRFTMINPDNVGSYDRNSELYKKYTAPGKNIVITPEIAAKAREVVGSEQNPYKAARKVYDYIVHDLTYSTMPHGALAALGIPESVYVHEHGYGDCGGQSIYFSAMMRSLGIPARASGGWQLVPGVEGDHFWAEFYLSNYGWVPVDTSVAQIGLLPLGHTQEEVQTYIDYFFGNMDPYRWVIQKDVDAPLEPDPSEQPAFEMALQGPLMVLESFVGIPEIAFSQYFTTTVAPAP
jgi:transglutaminase-like putative cysteine protease